MGQPTPPIQPGGGTASTAEPPKAPPRPANVYLSAQEQAAIAKAAGYPGGTVVGGQAIPQPKMGQDRWNQSVMVDTGEYQVNIQDARGNNIPVTITRGQADDQGNPTWGLSNMQDKPPTPAKTPYDYVVNVPGQGAWIPNDVNNPDGQWHMAVPAGVPNADDEIKKAVDRQVAEGDRNARQRNEAATGFYGTDSEKATFDHQAAADKLGQDQLAQRIVEFNRTQKNADAAQETADKKATQDILQSQAQTTLIGKQAGGVEATTAATTQATDQAKQLQPTTVEQAKATLAGTLQNTATAKQAQTIAAQSTLQGGLTNPYLTTVNPMTGQVDQSQMNKAYQPKTQAEIAARVGQIQQLMQQKGQEVQAKVGTNGFTHEQALQEFNSWYAQNVAPQQQSLQAAQDQAAFDRGTAQAATRTAAQTAALGAGNQQTTAFNAMVSANPVGPGYAEAMDLIGKGKMPSGQQMANAFTYEAADPMAAAKQGTTDALKYIDPTAAQAAGLPPPNYNAIDINAAFAPSQYVPGAGMPPGPPGGGGAPPPPPPQAPPPPFAHPFYGGLQQGYGAAPQQDFRGLAQGTGPYGPSPWAYSPQYQFGG